MLVFLENLDAISTVLIAVGLGKNLAIVALDGTLVLDLALLDDADINVATGAKIMVHTGLDRLDYESLGLFLSHVLLILCLNHGCGSEGARAHCLPRTGIGVTIGGDLDNLGSLDVDATNDAVSTDVATVVEDVP